MLRNIGVNGRERGLIRTSMKGKPTVIRFEEESDRDVACHPYGEYEEYLMKEALAEV